LNASELVTSFEAQGKRNYFNSASRKTKLTFESPVHLDFLFLIETQIFEHFGRGNGALQRTKVGRPVLVTNNTSAKYNGDSLCFPEV
jgi:hypothetical protein